VSRLEQIAEDLIAMFKADQMLRREAISDGSKRSALAALDRRNTARLQQIVDEIGWPSIPLVGETAAQAAWLLAQHADLDREFQRRCLGLMRALPEGAVWRHHLAYLEDRVLVGERKPQRYGTQLRRRDDGTLEPMRLIDPEQVDERRARVGLEPLAEYIRTVSGLEGDRR
jgi:hypothetical protein